jgi:hypothetical protein
VDSSQPEHMMDTEGGTTAAAAAAAAAVTAAGAASGAGGGMDAGSCFTPARQRCTVRAKKEQSAAAACAGCRLACTTVCTLLACQGLPHAAYAPQH